METVWKVTSVSPRGNGDSLEGNSVRRTESYPAAMLTLVLVLQTALREKFEPLAADHGLNHIFFGSFQMVSKLCFIFLLLPVTVMLTCLVSCTHAA